VIWRVGARLLARAVLWMTGALIDCQFWSSDLRVGARLLARAARWVTGSLIDCQILIGDLARAGRWG